MSTDQAIGEPLLRSETASILVYEDQAKDAERLCEQIASRGVGKCSVAGDLATYERKVREREFDAVSVDLLTQKLWSGLEILRRLKTTRAPMGRLVYSAYKNKAAQAQQDGADDFLEKKESTDADVYTRRVLGVARLGVARRIWRNLQQLEVHGLPHEPTLQELASQLRILLLLAVERLMDQKYSEPSTRSLLDDVSKFQIKRLDTVHFAELSWSHKMRMICQIVGITSPEAGTILCSDDLAHCIVDEDQDITRVVQDPQIDRLYTCCSYVLRLSDYDTVMAPVYWTLRDLFGSANNPPPWDSVGLRNYLLSCQRDGLADATTWIARH